ncbi:DinB family protein [Winogradskyella sp. DF17]|jgi:hypothetical protein|uniref:DinB family protein n=1 Tax=Winogradskyella pelagia TaxID=2819984 RepID=A0ABS3T6B7_9FLAO|nr:DinB family protein [Winogradskyella sp. DF17]MBO3117994.1 DinB family protein [Winogradskyella sp. DF17]
MDWAFDITTKNRTILKSYLENLSLEDLNKIPRGFNNNIIWNIAHVVATQQILVYTLSGLEPIIDTAFINKYRKGTKPDQLVFEQEVNVIKGLLFSTIEQTEKDYKAQRFKTYTTYTVSTKSTITSLDEAIEFNNFHEGIHLGYIYALRKLI